jgi:predicted DNA-binding protein
MKEEMKTLSVRIPEELHRRIRLRAAFEGTSQADLVRRILDEHINLPTDFVEVLEEGSRGEGFSPFE